jgi:Ni/Fe-hydrogenase 1 B-type cytochrome subunit
MSTTSIPPPQQPVEAESTSPMIKLYVWELPVRLAHWGIVFSILALSFTGYYMHAPFLISYPRTGYVMGTVRFVHLLAAWIFMGSLLLRIYWFFMGNRWAHLRAFLPHTHRQKESLTGMVTYYSLFKPEPYHQVGHNTLAAVTYLLMYTLMGIECLTGLALYSEVLGNRALSFFIGWLPRLIDIQHLRMWHYALMFVFLAFLIHHVYSALLVAHEEQNGLMESIFSGYKFVTSRLADDEVVEGEEQRFGKKGQRRR